LGIARAGCQLPRLGVMRPAVTDGTTELTPEIKPWIAGIHAYGPGRSTPGDGRVLAKLSANENPLGTGEAALAARAAAVMPSLYLGPDSTELREALGTLPRT